MARLSCLSGVLLHFKSITAALFISAVDLLVLRCVLSHAIHSKGARERCMAAGIARTRIARASGARLRAWRNQGSKDVFTVIVFRYEDRDVQRQRH
jgi:hypothetical protein